MLEQWAKPNRREMLKAAATTALAVGLRPASKNPNTLTQGGAQPAFKYIDVHVHLTQTWNERREVTPAILLRWMDLHQIEKAWVLPLVSPEAWFYPISTEWVLQQTAPFRDRLIPFCAVDPRTTVFGGEAQFDDLLKRYRDAGARGFGEHKWGGAIDDPRNIELMRSCAKANLPVLVHIDNERNIDTPGLGGLERLLEAVPDLTVIGHGPGWWASISAAVNQGDLNEYPKGPIEAGGALDRLLTKFPNLYGDLSAGSGFNALRRDEAFSREFLIRHQNQIVFGTDFLAEDQPIPQFDLFDSIDLPQSTREKIFYKNAEHILAEQ